MERETYVKAYSIQAGIRELEHTIAHREGHGLHAYGGLTTAQAQEVHDLYLKCLRENLAKAQAEFDAL